MISVFSTYRGWENANYVTGEMGALGERTPAGTLKIGALLAASTVWILSLFPSEYMVLDSDTITDKHPDLGMVLYFAPKVFGSSLGMKVCLAISAFGNVLAVTYTVSKGIISNLNLYYPTTSNDYIFVTGLFTYRHLVVSGFVTMGSLCLEWRMREVLGHYHLIFFKCKWLLWPVSIIFALIDLPVLIFSAKPADAWEIPRLWWPVTSFPIMTGSLIYWGVMMIVQIKAKSKGKNEKKPRTIGSIIGFEVKIYRADEGTPEEMEESIVQSRQDGSKRMVYYEVYSLVTRLFVRLD
ncbi:hypothetical protein K469DRAFT_688646 [Zopfia rhizophila CBS 207.26]|uniref:Amino acid permease/ SLC12A domain-containing protein n=1 Tax=Zopfia rhizophila CBS 207.26 TaxID=1314779 RepID=A0A6A6DY85_9PEZI|nr:hypothetical protein K469DRAFT_688646 [Zopfia rhizophila CBS 207.26]